MEPSPQREPAESSGASAAQIAPGTRCVICGYDLTGLWLRGICPECGAPVERSLRGDRLAYSAPEYVRTLTRGAGVINLVLLAQTLSIVGSIAWAIAAAATGLSMNAQAAGQYAMSGVRVIASIAGLVGWWLLSAPEPRLTGAHRGRGPRFWVRVSIVAQASMTALSFALSLAAPAAAGPQSSAALGVAAGGLVLGLLNLAAYVLWFFASMLYLRWLAPRIPSRSVYRWAKTFIWLGPVLLIPGALLCIGPLAAYVCYWVMLYRVWSDLRGVETAPATPRAGAEAPSA